MSCALVAAEVHIQTGVVRTNQHIYVFMSLFSLILKTQMQKCILFSAHMHRNMYKVRPQSKDLKVNSSLQYNLTVVVDLVGETQNKYCVGFT